MTFAFPGRGDYFKQITQPWNLNILEEKIG